MAPWAVQEPGPRPFKGLGPDACEPPGPLLAHWALVGQELWAGALVGRARVGPLGPCGPGPCWPGPRGPGPCGPGPCGPGPCELGPCGLGPGGPPRPACALNEPSPPYLQVSIHVHATRAASAASQKHQMLHIRQTKDRT